MQQGILLISAETLLQKLPPSGFIAGTQLPAGNWRAVLDGAGQRAAGTCRLQHGGAGERTRRVCTARLVVRCLPHGQPAATAHRSVRRRHRQHPLLRSRYAALAGKGGEAAAAASPREFPLDEESCKEFRRRYRTRFEGDPTRSAIYRGLRQNIAPPGIEFYLPLFFDTTATLFDYLPQHALFVSDSQLDACASIRCGRSIVARHEDRRHDIEHPVLDPGELFVEPAQLLTALAGQARIEFRSDAGSRAMQARTASVAGCTRRNCRWHRWLNDWRRARRVY